MCMLIAKFSSQAHELMLQFHLGSSDRGGEVLAEPGQVQRSRTAPRVVTQGPAEGTLSLGELEARKGRMQVRSATRRRAARIRDDRPGACDDS
ncbi:hypothetical protein ABIE44_000407 [Marmoricola sp. OAE513]